MKYSDDFSLIFNQIYPRLCRFLECLLGNSSIAQDIAQESMLRLYRHGLDKLPPPEVRFWVFRVARNLAIKEINRKRRVLKFFNRVVEIFYSHSEDPERELLA